MRIDRIVLSLVLCSAGVAAADDTTTPSTTEEAKAQPKEPEAGDFDAGGQVRLPNGPDEMGKYATYNWIAVDARGKYYLTKDITVDGYAPLAIVHPDTLMDGSQPKMFGGLQAQFEAKLPKLGDMPMVPHYDIDMGLKLDVTYMHERAMLLSEKDFPLFIGDYTPGIAGGLRMKIKLSSLVDFSLTPKVLYQGGGKLAAIDAVQVPTSLILKLGDLVKVAADVGVYTGDDFKFGGDSGGRVALGASLDVKIGPILTHVGGGLASLMTGPAYPTVRDSVYLDLNVKYAK